MRKFTTTLLVLCVNIAVCSFAYAQTADEIQKQIDDQNAKLTSINKEIAQYQAQLDATSAKKKTLQNNLNQILVSLKKTAASITATKNKLRTTQLQLQQLSNTIASTQTQVDRGKTGVAETIRIMNMADDRSLAAQILAADDISTAWEDVDAAQSVREALRQRIGALTEQENVLTQAKSAADKKKEALIVQQKTLVAQQGSITATKNAQSELLAQTKAQESAYQKLIAQKKAQEAGLEAALSDLNAKFRVAVNVSQITPAGAGTLQWPVDDVGITQYFGNTPFAASGAYNGKGHNGIDLKASIGTPIKAALSGTVLGAGNTDAIRGCYSFGKWVLIKHANGLDTVYAHLSQINVSQGQSVQTGDLIGYSGETGYATGPHLHFGVYVSSATQIIKLSQATNKATPCANAVMPVAPLSGYLNPLNYLPAR